MVTLLVCSILHDTKKCKVICGCILWESVLWEKTETEKNINNIWDSKVNLSPSDKKPAPVQLLLHKEIQKEPLNYKIVEDSASSQCGKIVLCRTGRGHKSSLLSSKEHIVT